MKYQLRHFLSILILFAFGGHMCSQPQVGFSSQSDTSVTCITTKLDLPFGTIARLEVEVIDGSTLHMKAYEGTYLLSVIYNNDKAITGTILLPFTDETGTLANEESSLLNITYGKTAKTPSSKQMAKMKADYIGNFFTIMAYETGQFIGMPGDYHKTMPMMADRGFHFEHSLVVIANLTK